MGSNRTVSIAIVILLHVILGYALVSGLAYNVVKKTVEDLKTFDVEDEPPPPPEEPPPPPENIPDVPPPVVAPPPIVRTNVAPPPVVATPVAPPPVVTPTAPVAPPAPPAPPPPRIEPARAKANLASYISNDDYPSRAIRNEEQGTTRFRLTVGANGRVSKCEIVGSSGSSTLDQTTCSIMERRARFTPATDSTGKQVTDTVTSSIRWVLPDR
ncbi:energy transducer TonB [Sphingomicrobium nitratireducens]|uniref:energy transducer TonB n=1 Tax=Sphingomicrobium nitratireducens TaxID=2964666 RepID=UPI0030B8767D